jgi:hypothetical protein
MPAGGIDMSASPSATSAKPATIGTRYPVRRMAIESTSATSIIPSARTVSSVPDCNGVR